MGSARMQESCHEVVFHTSTCLGVSNRSPRLSLSSPSLSSFSFLGDLASLVGSGVVFLYGTYRVLDKGMKFAGAYCDVQCFLVDSDSAFPCMSSNSSEDLSRFFWG